jgi:hypothetical protein
MTDYPIPFFFASLFTLWLAAQIGLYWRRKRPMSDEERSDFAVVQGASLTLLGLIIGFSFSMALGRYDQRKNYEEAEANAIGTEYVRAGLMPAAEASTVQTLLTKYTDLRILYYQTRGGDSLRKINADTAQLQAQLWSTVQVPVKAQPTPVMALVASGMNDVLNSEGYTQAAWWYRIPASAWGLMFIIAIFCCTSIGFAKRTSQAAAGVLYALPLVVSISLFLIADIDSPRGGLIRVVPQNLVSLSQSFPH